MAFSEQLKLRVKRKAHFACGLCHSLYVEVHHIVPQAEGGGDTEENAAALCPTCHDLLGANPTKRKFIREACDFWYELCETRYATDPDRLDEISRMLKAAATKEDLDRAIVKLVDLTKSAAANETRPVPVRAQDIGQLGAYLAPGVSTNRQCKRCGTTIGLYIGDQGKCPSCGTPW